MKVENKKGNEKMIRSIEASKYIQMPFFKLRERVDIKKYKHTVKAVPKSEKSKEIRYAFRKTR